jgi:hypothetical protein
MDDSSIAGLAEKLCREVKLIEETKRRYRSHRTHSRSEIAEHSK